MSEDKADFLAKEFNVPKEVAQIALIHCHDSMALARDYLSNTTYQAICWREAREAGLST